MSKKIELECSHDDFAAVLFALDHTRRSSAFVRVGKDALAALLRDHGKLIRAHRGDVEGVL